MTVTGVIDFDNPQIDGRRCIREIWTDDLGNQYTYDYMADAGTDINSKMNARSDQVLQEAMQQAIG